MGGSSGSAAGSSGSAGGASGSAGGTSGSMGGSSGRSGGSGGSPRDAGTGSGGSGDAGTSSGEAGGGTNSPGCGKSITRPSASTQQTMTVGGTTRYYLLDVPSSADNTKPLMLIFALHGYNMNNISIQGLFNFTSKSNGKAITVYPQGNGDPPGNVSHWGSGISSSWDMNDANSTFIHDLMVDLESRYCIDTSRVFFAGFSMGGLFTNYIACEHSDWFRAYAPVEGMGPGGSQDGTKPLSCANANAKPAIMIHQGTADTNVPPKYGEATRDFWANQNGCSKTTTASFTGCQSYSACAEPVIYCVGSWDHTIDPKATSNIWSFFSGF
jgi:poly(3-hydroxybutyrate) depolymerase